MLINFIYLLAIAFILLLYKKNKYTIILVLLLWYFYRKNVFCYRFIYYNKLNFFYKDETTSPFKVVEVYNYNSEDKNIFSTSLYGNSPKYYKNIDNIIEGIEKLDQKWTLRVYLHDMVDVNIKNKLIDKGIQLFIVNDPLVKSGNSSGAFWRFMPLKEDIRFICIDSDDAFDVEFIKKAINTWIESGDKYFRTTGFQVFKHAHFTAKWWGANRANLDIPITNYKHRSSYGADEVFLSEEIYPIAKREGFTNIIPNRISSMMFSVACPSCGDDKTTIF